MMLPVCVRIASPSSAFAERTTVARSVLPTMGQMINDQTGGDAPAETQAQMRARDAPDL